MYKGHILLFVLCTGLHSAQGNLRAPKRASSTPAKKPSPLQKLLTASELAPQRPAQGTGLTASDIEARLRKDSEPVPVPAPAPETTEEYNTKILRAFWNKKIKLYGEAQPRFANQDLLAYAKGYLNWIIHDRLQRVACKIEVQKTAYKRPIYKNQRYKICSPKNELHGPLGGMLARIDEANQKLEKCQLVCCCATKNSMIQLKPEVGWGEIKSLMVPTDRGFDLALEKEPDSHYLTVYERPGYKPPLKDDDFIVLRP